MKTRDGKRLIRRNAAPVCNEPVEYLMNWQIVTAPNGDRHFLGIRSNEHTIRISSRIVLYNDETQNGMTASGRIYRLIGPPAETPIKLIWED